VAQQIATAVKVPLSPAEEVQMASAKTVDPAVYEAYLQGRYWAGKFGEEDLRKAQGYFERAVALDPSFAGAWSGLSDTLMLLGLFHTDTTKTLAQSQAAAEKALQIDPSDPEAWATLSNISLSRWQWSEAEKNVRRALELDPNSAQAHRRYWLILVPQLRLEEAALAIETARRLDPLSARIASNVGLQRLFEGDQAAAEAELKRALVLEPDYGITHAWLWMLYAQQRKDPDRGAELRSYLAAVGLERYLPEFDRRLREGGYEEALGWIASQASKDYWDKRQEIGVIAGLLAEAGRKEEAIRWLRLGVESHAWEMPWLSVSPDYRNLYGEPDFSALLSELGLPQPSAAR
jgi:Tfp pilus assembly protein PilF